MNAMLYITSVRLFPPFLHQRVLCLWGLSNLAGTPGDVSFITESVNNLSQGSEPQSISKAQGTISCDFHDFHLLLS